MENVLSSAVRSLLIRGKGRRCLVSVGPGKVHAVCCQCELFLLNASRFEFIGVLFFNNFNYLLTKKYPDEDDRWSVVYRLRLLVMHQSFNSLFSAKNARVLPKIGMEVTSAVAAPCLK